MNVIRIVLVTLICCLCSFVSTGQVDTSDIYATTQSPWLAPVVTDDMTKDPEQNRLWRLGQGKYSAKPKHMWELGVHGGHYSIDGDVDRKIVAGYGVGLHLRKALTYFTSIRFEGFYGSTKGLETQPWRHRNFGGGLVEQNNQFQGWENYDGSNAAADSWFPAYKTQYYYGAVQLIFNVGNVLFHKERNKWNTYVALGVGVDHNSTKLDLLDESGSAYEALRERTNWSRDLFNTADGRREITAALEAIYDGVYETDAFQQEGIYRINDEFNIHGVVTGSVGVSRKISRRFNLGIEHQVIASDNDYLDGIKFRSSTDQSNKVDISHYTNLRLGINMGNFDKRIEPLYWVNPMETVMNDIAEVKARPRFEWKDKDNDGVLDLIDQELDTPDGCLVDTKGITLDSDGDGVVDCMDKEPFSAPGYPVDAQGIVQIDSSKLNILTEEDVITLIRQCDGCQNVAYGVLLGEDGVNGSDGINGSNGNNGTTGSNGVNGNNGANGQNGNSGSNGASGVNGNSGTNGSSGVNGSSGSNGVNGSNGQNGSQGAPGRNGTNTYGTITHTGCGNWFLPMIHFDLDKYALRPEAYVSLHQIANVMRKCPEICVTAHGHTDVRNSNRYNQVLSFKRAKEAVDYLVTAYGIDRSRFKLMYGGEDSPLIPNLKSNHYTTDIEEQMQFINRRVEFRVCDPMDFDMVRPDGPDAGVRSLGSSRAGSKYNVKGNKNSGY